MNRVAFPVSVRCWMCLVFLLVAEAAAAALCSTADGTCTQWIRVATVLAPQAVLQRDGKKLPVVAYLGVSRSVLDEVLAGMLDLGYVAERHFHLEARLTGGVAEEQTRFAAELVALRPDVIVAVGTASLDLKKFTSTLPIVVTATPEVTALKVMDSLERPGGNVTGVVGRQELRAQKEFSLLKEVVPGLRRVAVLTGLTSINPATQTFAFGLGLRLDIVSFTSADQLESAFEKLAAGSPQALFVGGSPLTIAQISRIARLAAAHGWPAVSEYPEFAKSGGLMSYGGNGDGARRAAGYVDRILKGAKPSDLPVEVQQDWQLLINMSTAKQLGLTIPEWVLSQAAEIIP